MTDAIHDPKHNNPPEDLPYDEAIYSDLESRINAFNDAIGEFLDLGELTSADQAAKLNDTIAGARKLEKQVADALTEQKKPYETKVATIRTAFGRLKDRIEAIKKSPQALQNAWLKKEQDRLNAEREAERQRVQEERAKVAAMATKAQARNDVIGQADAEAELKKIEKAEAKLSKDAPKARIGSATGGAKTVSARAPITKGRINHFGRVVNHYRDDPWLLEALDRMIARDIRSRDVDHTKIPGIEFYQE